jgi:ribosomal protection tetracycline resistance protein
LLHRTLNLGILAHVDAGKTTLTERLLYAAGVIDEIGSVDDGTTQTDSLALERQRGITIKSAVVSLAIDDVTVNLIDTPGHPDFIAEVERALSVLDGAVLVISAVEGVQAQTRLLMRALQRLRVPTLIFVNKIDRQGASCERTLHAISRRLTPAIVPLGSVRGLGTRTADVTPWGPGDAAFVDSLASALADHDDAILSAYVDDDTSLPYSRLREELAAQTRRALLHPVFFGSALTGVGVEPLMGGIAELLPAGAGDADGPVSATAFKIERGPAGDRIAYVRMFSGTVRTRDRLRFRGEHEGKVTAIRVFARGRALQSPAVVAGQIAKLWGLAGIQIGDAIGSSLAGADDHLFAPPTLETVVVPVSRNEKGALHAALVQLAEQDPLINLRQDDDRQELFVSLYGEVQKEVIQETLATEFDLDVEFRETTQICIERPSGSGAALDLLGGESNPFLATVGLRIDPAPIGSGVGFRLRVPVRSIPLYVYGDVESFGCAIEETVRQTLQHGLYGWQVTDCTVTMTDCGYSSPGTSARDFRRLTPLVLADALKEAGTEVCEPIHTFYLEGPADSLPPTLRLVAQLHAEPHAPTISDSSFALDGVVAAARMHVLQQQLRPLTRGEGVLEFAFDRYEPVKGTIPTRPRSGDNPLNRGEYLLHLSRRLKRG